MEYFKAEAKDSMSDLDTVRHSYTDAEYDGRLDQKQNHPQRKIQLSTLAAAGIALAFLLLFTIPLYLLLLLRHIPSEVRSLIRSSSYTGPIPIQYDPTHGAYVQCEDVPYPEKPADCTFDLLANGYVPNPCFDSALHSQYVDGKDYSFYLHYNGTGRVSQEAIMQGNLSAYPDGFWVSFREHREHCWYLLNATAMANARRQEARLDIWVDGEHIMHCLELVKEEKHEDGFIADNIKAQFENRKCYLGSG
ncbi:hypothetical protein BDW71DRAFT_210098 [Aspergillus fruticulosus]